MYFGMKNTVFSGGSTKAIGGKQGKIIVFYNCYRKEFLFPQNLMFLAIGLTYTHPVMSSATILKNPPGHHFPELSFSPARDFQ